MHRAQGGELPGSTAENHGFLFMDFMTFTEAKIEPTNWKSEDLMLPFGSAVGNRIAGANQLVSFRKEHFC